MAANTSKICFVCKMSETDDINYGKWEQLEQLNVHYYCLLLSSKMEQNGHDDQGILGFLEADIRKCVSRIKTTKCFYCMKKSASIQCQRKSCNRSFHLICGVKNNCLFQFTNRYNSYCHEHSNVNDDQIDGHDKCMICWESMGAYNPLKSIPSCCNAGWIHAYCMRKTAISFGYLFHCPMCGIKNEDYKKKIRNRGIFIPDRDASWELSQNAYASLLFECCVCDAIKCYCPNGRNFTVKRKRSKWLLLKCIYCGSKGIHFGCSPPDMKEYKCDECIVTRSQSLFSQQFQAIQSQMPNETSETSVANEIDIVDLTIDTNSKNSDQRFVIDASKPSSDVQSTEISSSTINDEHNVNVEGNMGALITVPDFGFNIFKERSIILAKDQPPLGTQYVEDNNQLSKDRINLLLFGKRF